MRVELEEIAGVDLVEPAMLCREWAGLDWTLCCFKFDETLTTAALDGFKTVLGFDSILDLTLLKSGLVYFLVSNLLLLMDAVNDGLGF